MKRKKTLRFPMLLVLLALLLGVCLLADGLEMRFGWRRDHSFNAMTTASETTLKVLSELPYPVHIYAVYRRGAEDGPLLELLNRYQSASDKVTWEQVDLSLNPSLLTRFRSSTSTGDLVTNDAVIVSCEATGRFRTLDASDFYTLGYDPEEGSYGIAGLAYESSLTNAIRYVTLEDIPRVCVLQGHGELDASGTAVLSSMLEENNYEVDYVNLTDGGEALSGADVLMILSPVRDLMDTEMEAIAAFASGGGSVLFTCDYTDPVAEMPHFSTLMRSFGFVPRDGLVIASEEEPGSYYADYRIFLIPVMQGTEITADLMEAGASTLLLAGTRAFETPERTDRDLTVWTVLSTGPRAYLRPLDGDLSDLGQKDGDAMGPFALALQAERVTDSGEVSRAFALGCSTLLTSSEVYAMTDAQEFILRVMEYLARQEPADLQIMARQAVRPGLGAGSVWAGEALAFLLPALVLALGLAVLLPRYRKH